MKKNYFTLVLVSIFLLINANKSNAQCTDPSGLSITNITAATADFSWQVNGGTNFQVAYVTTGSPAPSSGTAVVGGNYQFTGLAPATTYDAYVRNICGSSDSLVITGVLDGPLTGGIPKAIELKVLSNIPDLSKYGIGVANNGGGTDGQEFTFPAVSATAGSFIYVTNDSTGFHNFMGFAANFKNTAMDPNGDDAIELFKNGTVIDLFGDINVDGTGKPWEFLDGWVYRNNDIAPNPIFTETDWAYSGINQLEGGLTNGTCTIPFPLGTYTSQSTVSNWIMTTFTTTCDIAFGDIITSPIYLSGDTIHENSSNANCFTDTQGEISADVFYKFSIHNPCVETISITTCGSDFDTQLTLFDKNGTQLGFDDNSATCGSNLSMINYVVSPLDTFIVMIEGTGVATGNFTLNVTPTSYTIISTSITSQTNNDCFGDSSGSVTLDDNSGAFTFIWDPSTGNQTGPTATGLAAGTYGYLMSNGSGCNYYDVVTITQPTKITATGFTTNEVLGGDGEINITISGGTPPYHCSWSNTSSEEDITGLVGGIYTVTIEDDNACVESFNFTVASELGIQENALNTTLSVFPNPSNGSFQLDLGYSESTIQINVVNALGQTLQSFESQGNEQLMISLNNAAGIYYIRLMNNNGTAQLPIIVK